MKAIVRHEIRCDGKPHVYRLPGEPLWAAAGRDNGHLWFWAESDDGEQDFEVTLQVVRTGEEIPHTAMWMATVAAGDQELHLIQIPPEDLAAFFEGTPVTRQAAFFPAERDLAGKGSMMKVPDLNIYEWFALGTGFLVLGFILTAPYNWASGALELAGAVMVYLMVELGQRLRKSRRL